MVDDLALGPILTRDITQLSGGELQRLAIAVVSIQQSSCYLFDEPSSYLDIKQRLIVARLIRSLANEKTYVMVVEHDLAVLDYLSDIVCSVIWTSWGLRRSDITVFCPRRY